MGIVVLGVEGSDDDVDGSSRAARLQERQDTTEAHDKQTSTDKEMNNSACLGFPSLVSCWTPRFC